MNKLKKSLNIKPKETENPYRSNPKNQQLKNNP
jgi:hypothetical protein